ncbi:c-type cytochrome [Oceanicella actignis]|uniref:Cytochrome c n=1 Tax=Oceanicella actignis TaxID=1189325 RepID=A0A1M7SCW8_9RHOB|nr:cytochrome c family protein [Oceanicella actignis]SET25803.1 cytochrome c [Oceanicella actignis]SHN56314.1 cytochrome c [Oceanicella actignis]
MDTMEFNKFFGAAVGALLVYMGLGFFSELIYRGGGGHDGEHHYAYALAVEEGGDEGAAKEEEVPFADLLAQADPAKGEKVFGKCKACHKLDGTNATGPHLKGVVGRPVGAVEGFNYSAAMASHGGEWTPEALNEFLAKPKDYIPGTKMSFAGLKKVEDRANLIAYLQSVQAQ